MASLPPNDDTIEPTARDLIAAHGRRYASQLLEDATILAISQQRKVNVSHIETVLRRRTAPKWRRPLREGFIFIGGALFSVLVQSLLTPSDTGVPVPQVVLGIVGLFMVFVALFIET